MERQAAPQPCANAKHGCSREARMAVRTTRPHRDNIRITIFADNRTAPLTATPYCHDCGASLVQSLLATVVDADEAGAA